MGEDEIREETSKRILKYFLQPRWFVLLALVCEWVKFTPRDKAEHRGAQNSALNWGARPISVAVLAMSALLLITLLIITVEFQLMEIWLRG